MKGSQEISVLYVTAQLMCSISCSVAATTRSTYPARPQALDVFGAGRGLLQLLFDHYLRFTASDVSTPPTGLRRLKPFRLVKSQAVQPRNTDN